MTEKRQKGTHPPDKAPSGPLGRAVEDLSDDSEIKKVIDGAKSGDIPVANSNHRLLRVSQIIGEGGLIPVSRSTFYGYVKDGLLPRGIKLSERVTAWREADILAFIAEREEQSK